MEIRQNNPQQRHRALALIQANPGRFARYAMVITDWKKRGSQWLGPYYRLRYWDEGRVRSIYLGRDGPLVEQVRQALAAAQGPWQRRRDYQRQRRQIVASLRAHKGELDRQLRLLGLRLKGYEVRGWRTGRARWKVR